VVQERVFVGPGGTLYTLNRRTKTLSSVNGVISVGSSAPATAKSVSSGAQRSAPVDAGFDALGDVYVLDKSLAEVRVYSATGTLLRQFGRPGSGNDALLSPSALAVYQGSVFIADSANHRIQVFSTAGVALSRFGTLLPQGGGMNYPKDIKVAADGSMYVLQGGKSLVTVYTSAGVQTQQFDLSKNAQGERQSISAIALSPAGVLYAADLAQGRIYLVAKDGSLTQQATPATASATGKPTAARYLAVGSGEQLHLSGFVTLRS
jgi:glucose/arabinose dehydrogenase